eukprot:2496612-Pyramimonas_sp.AAC.1
MARACHMRFGSLLELHTRGFSTMRMTSRNMSRVELRGLAFPGQARQHTKFRWSCSLLFVPQYQEPALCGDCMNVAELHDNNPSEHRSAKQRYGGMRRGALPHMRNNDYAPAARTPAHRKLEDIELLRPP